MSLKIVVRQAPAAKENADVLAVGTHLLGGQKKKNAKPTTLDAVDRALGGALVKQMKHDEFRGKKDQTFSMHTLSRIASPKVYVYGLGDGKPLSDADLRTFAAKIARASVTEKAKRLVLALPAGLESRLRPIVEGLELGAYRFSKYLTGDRAPKSQLAHVTIITAVPVPVDAKKQVEVAQAVAAGVVLARDLSNEPPNVLYPDTLAEAARAMSKEHGLKCLVMPFAEVQKRGMKLLEAVGQGSVRKPCMVHISYVPPPVKGAPARKKLVFVGKGITFDTGGISIKPAAGMGEMKHDMSGAANVVGLMAIVGALKPNCEVHAILAAAENMPDGNAYRPGDVFGSLDGKTVEIVNTDAEGRLVLADALAYARTLAPDLLVDNATLTGACVVALGNTCSGWYANNEDTAAEFAAAQKESGENMWRMPLLDELKDQLKSDVADIKHTGDRWGGSITAALFLREFIGDVKNWVHCDIAGPAMADRVFGWQPKAGTGHGVLTFYRLVERAAAGDVGDVAAI